MDHAHRLVEMAFEQEPVLAQILHQLMVDQPVLELLQAILHAMMGLVQVCYITFQIYINKFINFNKFNMSFLIPHSEIRLQC